MDTLHTTATERTPRGPASPPASTRTRPGRWESPLDPRRERTAILLAVFGALPALIASGSLTPVHPALGIGALVTAGACAVNALVRVRRVPRLVISGLAGGGVAGLVAIGAGSRFAMRIVALTGGRREVTLEGTVFLLIMGAMVGAFIGLVIAALLRVWKLRGLAVGLALMAFPGGTLLLSEDTRAELLHEGLGGWLNIPMFFALFPLFGVLAVAMTRRIDRLLPLTRGWHRV